MMESSNRQLARIVTLPRLAVASVIGTVLLAVATYLQRQGSQECVEPLKCEVLGHRADGSSICKTFGCGPDPWLFAAPALALGVVAVGLVLLNRQRNRSAAA
jgi:hypothetical protein